MHKFIHLAVAYFITVPATLQAKKERGALTMEQVIWTAALALLAVAAVALITTIVNGWLAKIPT